MAEKLLHLDAAFSSERQGLLTQQGVFEEGREGANGFDA